MKTGLLAFLVTLLCAFDSYSSDEVLAPVDSIRIQLDQLTGKPQNDTVTLHMIVGILERNSYDAAEIQALSEMFEQYNRVLNKDLQYRFKFLLAQLLNDSGYTYESIEAYRALISELQHCSTPFQKFTLIESLWYLRFPYRNSDRIKEGITYYLQLIDSFDPVKEQELISICYHVLRSYYQTLGLLDKAIYYEQKAMQFQTSTEVVRANFILPTSTSSVGIVGTINRKAVLGYLYIENGEAEKALTYLYDARKMVEVYQDSIELGDAPFIYLEIIRAKMKLKEPVNTVDFSFAENLIEGSTSYIANFCQLKGVYFLQNDKLDSAEYYFQNALEIRDEYKLGINTFAGVLVPGFHLARVKLKQKKYKESINFLKSEIDILKISNLRNEILKELHLLYTVYKEMGDYEKSLLTLEEYDELRAELIRDEAENRSMTFEVEQNIANQKRAIDELEVENRFNRKSKYYFSGIAILVLLIAIGLYAGYRSKKKANVELARKNVQIVKEKERSENLLLNILPPAVAEELKAKGYTDAQFMEDVTVLFTDFKGFTQLAEKLSPRMLVAEINECFSAFDNIMAKHGVEKIKTIGDAYMAVGGLPTANNTHAIDVVNAALDIQQFMYERKIRKAQLGELFFEIRIGIHSGPVVAGIVGVKKFQYDVWGDTVNTASRMESGSETGRINVSGATYELIQNSFQCTYRGKLPAKNKGEIEMYFVEGLL